jgi:hypothetical protein
MDENSWFDKAVQQANQHLAQLPEWKKNQHAATFDACECGGPRWKHNHPDFAESYGHEFKARCSSI